MFCKEHDALFGPKLTEKEKKKIEKLQEERKKLEQKQNVKDQRRKEKEESRKKKEKKSSMEKPLLVREKSVGKTLEDELRSVWKGAREIVYKDLPRLAKRMTIHSFPSGVEVELEGQQKEDKDKDASLVGTSKTLWRSISNIIQTVAYRLEDEEQQAKIARGLEEMGKGLAPTTDVELVLGEAFRKVIGNDSKTARVFKATHQSILFPAILYLRQQVYGEALGSMKDVRRPDGWVIRIQLGDANFVTHTRWEQAIAPPGSPEHFEVQWEIRMSFDKNMSDIRAVFLRIMDLKFSESMPIKQQEKLRTLLRGDGYIV